MTEDERRDFDAKELRRAADLMNKGLFMLDFGVWCLVLVAFFALLRGC